MAKKLMPKWFRFATLAFVVVAFVSHLPAQAGDSCGVASGVLSCPGECNVTFGPDAPVLGSIFKLKLGADSCQPSWEDLKRLLPGLMVSSCFLLQ
jgi:hypothetical protein